MPTQPDLLSSEQFATILDDAVAEILSHEDSEQFLGWMRAQAHRYFGHLPFVDAGGPPAMAAALGRAIWNSTPLPGNHFSPRRIDPPGRNDPCPCGSGRKFKQCCAGSPEFTALAQEDVWPFVIDHLDQRTLETAVAEKRIPQVALATAAQRMIEEGSARRAAQLLEPLFDGRLDRLDERFEDAFDTLCDAYLELGYENKRRDLVYRVARGADRTLSRAAWERMATIHMDRGEHDEAWAAFQAAQRADPGHPSLALSEVMLLITERRYDEASARAKFWAAKLAKSDSDVDGLIDTLERIAEDPAGALADTFLEREGVEIESLRAWVDGCRDRPLPAYRAVEPAPIDAADSDVSAAQLRAHLAQSGIPSDQLDQAVSQLLASLREMPAAPGVDARESGDQGPSHVLHPPKSLEAIQAGWHEVFPADKPFGVQLDSYADERVWEPATAQRWQEFLRRHPEAYDSLDILDDLATALGEVEGAMLPGVEDAVMNAIVDRGAAIVLELVDNHDVRLPWGLPQNRPALRLLARRVYRLLDQGDDPAAAALMRTLLRVNPTDNHGFRQLLVNHLLRSGDPSGALTLVAAYPGDWSVELRYGEVLAHYRLGNLDEAQRALAAALEVNAHVPSYLTQERPQEPKLSPGGATLGGRDEAWHYRSDAGDLWRSDPQLLQWLQRAARYGKRDR